MAQRGPAVKLDEEVIQCCSRIAGRGRENLGGQLVEHCPLTLDLGGKDMAGDL